MKWEIRIAGAFRYVFGRNLEQEGENGERG